ncbi:NOF-FB transposable element, partial [Pseudolycoriella hygida]
ASDASDQTTCCNMQKSLADFRQALTNLTVNDKKVIQVITNLAVKNRNAAEKIVNIFDEVDVNGLLKLYLLDSIVKTLSETYTFIFGRKLPEKFRQTFLVSDGETKHRMFKMRKTWDGVFPNSILFELDCLINKIDKNWPSGDEVIQQIDIKTKRNELLVDGELVKCTDIIYQNIANEFGVTKQSIYLSAKRFFIKAGTIKAERSNEADDENISDFIPTEYVGNDFKCDVDDILIQLNIEKVDLFVSANENKVNPEWSDTFNGILWEFFRLPCAWSYQRIREVCNEFVIVAQCRSMGCARVFGYTQNNKNILKIRLRSFNDEALHIKKISIKHSRKDIILKMLAQNPPSVVQAKMANQLMTDGDDDVASLVPTSNALSMLKCRSLKKVYLHENPILAICEMKKLASYRDIIGDIGLDPFYVQYCTPLQQELVMSKTRYRRKVISLDSTGLSVQDMPFSSVSEDDNEYYKDCFLYVINLQSPDGNQAAIQFISQRQNSDFIQYNLVRWKTQYFSKKNPDEAVMDHSSALLLSCINCFTSCKTMHQYLNDCFDSLFDGAVPPRCYIRLDRPNMVKEIIRLECFKHEDKRRKYLYQRIFGFLITIENIQDAETILQNMFTILFNKYENENHVSSAKMHLRNVCEKHLTFELDNDADDEIDSFVNDESIYSSQSKFRVWIQRIVDNVKQDYVNDTLNRSVPDDDPNLIDNLYYSPSLEKPFVDFLVRLPLFSNIMMKVFKSPNTLATSSPTEVGFNVFKNLVFNSKRKMRMDELLDKHIEFLNGNLNAHRSKREEAADIKCNINNFTAANEYFDENCESQEENWRSKNIDAKPKTTLFRNKRCKNSILNPVNPDRRFIPILKNGHRTIGTKTKIGILSTRTCAFDSTFQIFAACYIDKPSFAKKIESDDGELSTLLKNLFTNDEVYDLRNKILVSMVPEKVIKFGTNVNAIDCEISVHSFFMKLAEKHSWCNSFDEYKKCHTCHFVSSKIQKAFIPTNLGIIDLTDIASCLKINTRLASAALPRPENAENFIVKLSVISSEIVLGKQSFVLKGVIEYKSGHFVAHIQRNDGKWETYDDLSYAKVKKTPDLIYPVQLYYILKNESKSSFVQSVRGLGSSSIRSGENSFIGESQDLSEKHSTQGDNKRKRRLPSNLKDYVTN